MGMTFDEICKMTEKDDELFAERIRQHFIDIVNEVNKSDIEKGVVFTLREIGEVIEDETSTIDLSEEYYNENHESIYEIHEAAMAMLGSRIYREFIKCKSEEDVSNINLMEIMEDYFKDLIIMAAIK